MESHGSGKIGNSSYALLYLHTSLITHSVPLNFILIFHVQDV